MHKYRHYFFVALSQALVFRLDVMLHNFNLILRLGMLFVIWATVFTNQESIQSFTLQQVSLFSILSILLHAATQATFENTRSEEVRHGTIDLWLCKPLGYTHQILLAAAAQTVSSLLFSLPLMALVATLASKYGSLALPQLSFTSIGLVVLLVFAGWWVEHCIGLWIVAACFWFESAAGLQHFKWFALTLLSGGMIPLQLLPTWLSQLIELSPLKYLAAVPLGVLLGKYTWQLSDTFLLLGWCIVLTSSTVLIWKQAYSKYAGAGG